MKPFDFNIHLVPRKSDVNGQIHLENELTPEESVKCYKALRAVARRQLSGLNIMLFNQEWTHDSSAMCPLSEMVQADFGQRAVFTQLVDFRSTPSLHNLKTSRTNGLRGIKFHSYVQKIIELEWPLVLKWACAAADLNLFICIDASYGTAGMYEQDNLRLAAWLAQRITQAPIIILHSGGMRAFEAWLLAESCPNIWVETSFSINYYKGTRIEEDLATVYRRLSGERVLYASDHPYVPMQSSLKNFKRFLKKYRINDSMQRKMLNSNANNLLEMVQ
jgi:hypothetical protein